MGENEYRDYLTGILNRMGLFHTYEGIDATLTSSILFFDIDNFKTVNDMYGHRKGDETLICFSKILTETVPNNAIVARLGGDEFVAIIPGESDKTVVETIARNILHETKELKKKDRAFEIISTSIGILLDYKASDSLDNALSLADKALYVAKEQGKDTCVFYDDYEEIINYENDIEKMAVRALEEGRFFVKYHPTIHLESSRLIGTEACCVWRIAGDKTIGRNDFRSVLVKNGFVNEVDLFVLKEVCRHLSVIKKECDIKQKIGVQFSHLILVDNLRIKQIKDVLDEYGINPEDIEINFDEKMFSGRTSVEKMIEGMHKLREMGFSIAISQFGEDFSSVRYLKDMPISAVKFDGEFINDSLKDKVGIQVLRSTIKLIRGFKYTAVGCKVDDNDSMMYIADCGCDAATGDFYSKKLVFEEYLEYLGKMEKEDRDTISYRFNGNMSSDESRISGRIIGEDVIFEDGITDSWKALDFKGGPMGSNYAIFPADLIGTTSYTISMWLKPRELQNWVSALYIRYQNGFTSFMPNIAGGRCMYRIKEDTQMDIWHDAMTSALRVGRWTFVACCFDYMTSTVRVYVNGELESVITNVPALENPDNIWLGGDVFQMSYCGLISGLQINKSALDSEEIRNRYNSFREEAGYCGDVSEEVDAVTEIEVHDPAIYEDPVSGNYFIYGTGGRGLTSKDMIHWKDLGTVVGIPTDEAREWTGSDAIWAPDIVKVGDEYRLYCSNSSWGVRQSCIFLAVSDNPKGPFTPKGIVIKTSNDGNVNAIDANIIEEHGTGRQYMVYGSFWGGIHIIELDKTTGFAIEGQGQGTQIACRPAWNDGAIEGPYIIYHPETEYYYLFVSYGSLTCDYNIRVGRSKSVTGPYYDYNGRCMVDPYDADCTTGLMIACGYRYLTGQAYMGPGHNSVLLRDNGDMFLVSHIRKLSFNADPGPGLLQIRKMIMTPDGWPIALGQPYNAESLLTVRTELLYGEYERIELRPSIPQGVAHAHPMKILENGRLEMASVIGTWKRTGDYTLELSYGPITEFVHFEKGFDEEKQMTTVVMCGLTDRGICSWGKKEDFKY